MKNVSCDRHACLQTERNGASHRFQPSTASPPKMAASAVPLTDEGSRIELGVSLRRIAAIALIMAIPIPAFAQNEREFDRHPYEGFTQPFRIIDVAASEPGRVAEVKIKRGDIVKENQLLLRLDSSILETTRRIAEADAKASARIQALTVEHEVQKRRLEQYQALTDSGRASQEELLRAEADEQVALFTLQAAKEEQVKRQLTLYEIEARIAARSVRSPINGIITDVTKDVGESVSSAEPQIATIVDLRKLRVTFFLPTSGATALQPTNIVGLSFVDSQKTVDAIVEYVGATTEADSGRVRVDVLIDNIKGKYRSGLRCLLDRNSAINPRQQTAARSEALRR